MPKSLRLTRLLVSIVVPIAICFGCRATSPANHSLIHVRAADGCMMVFERKNSNHSKWEIKQSADIILTEDSQLIEASTGSVVAMLPIPRHLHCVIESDGSVMVSSSEPPMLTIAKIAVYQSSSTEFGDGHLLDSDDYDHIRLLNRRGQLISTSFDVIRTDYRSMLQGPDNLTP